MESEHDQTVHEQVATSVTAPVSDNGVNEKEIELCTITARYLLLLYGLYTVYQKTGCVRNFAEC